MYLVQHKPQTFKWELRSKPINSKNKIEILFTVRDRTMRVHSNKYIFSLNLRVLLWVFTVFSVVLEFFRHK